MWKHLMRIPKKECKEVKDKIGNKEQPSKSIDESKEIEK
jgi:hypothetical protein